MCDLVSFSPHECRQERDKMLSCGIDTHLKMHQVEVQNERRKVLWRGQIGNNRTEFNELLEKLRTIERSNSDTICGIFINPTGTYHVPIRHFLESNGYVVYYVDPRVTDSARTASNLGKVKSDNVDSHLLASAPWDNEKAMERRPHVRDSVSSLTRLLESVKKNITRVGNLISADLACVFPEFLNMFPDIMSKTSLAMLEKYSIPGNILKSGLGDVLDTMSKYSRNHYKREDAERILDLAKNSIGIPDVSGVYAFRIRENVKRLKAELNAIKEIEAEIIDATKDSEDVKRIDDIDGIGPMNAAAIVSEIGPIEQFASALKLQSFGGRVPRMKGSGGKYYAAGSSKVRNPYLSNAAYESAVSLVNHRSREFLDIFNREIGRGKKPVQAYNIVGKRLLYRVFFIMKNHKPYRQRLSGQGEGVSSTGS